MLLELRVENLLLIERAELRLAPGLNVLTGETGAGKTVLAHALDLLLGGRARAGIVRPGAGDPAAGGETMGPYLEAKAQADAALAASELDWTIVRPGGLTDEPGSGLVDVAPALERRGTITRDDVAAVLAGCLDEPRAVRATFDLLQGETPIAQALAAL